MIFDVVQLNMDVRSLCRSPCVIALLLIYCPLWKDVDFKLSSFQTRFSDYLNQHFRCCYLYVNDAGHYWLLVSIGWGNDLVPPGKSHFLNHCWQKAMAWYDPTRPHWVNPIKWQSRSLDHMDYLLGKFYELRRNVGNLDLCKDTI